MSLRVDIRKDFGSFLLETSFEADKGTSCILGPSGCGKSMTLKCIAGIVTPDEGHIELDGRVLFDAEKKINLPPQKRSVGYLFQNYALFPNMSVSRNIMCGMKRGLSRQEKEEACAAMIRLMKLDGLENRRPAQLSGGQQQRTALARILVSEPDVLLLDEPFSALDGYLRDSLKIELRDLLSRYGREVIMVTHDRTEAYNMSSAIGVMENGKLRNMKPTKELFADPGTVQAAILTGCKNIAEAEKTGPHTAYVPAWGVELTAAKELKDNLKAIGIRAHYFNPNTRYNCFPVTFTEEMEEPFETIIRFRYASQDPQSQAVWWRLPKEKKPQVFPEALGIAPVNILPLYEEETEEGEKP